MHLREKNNFDEVRELKRILLFVSRLFISLIIKGITMNRCTLSTLFNYCCFSNRSIILRKGGSKHSTSYMLYTNKIQEMQ